MHVEAKLEAYGPFAPGARSALASAVKPVRRFDRGATLQAENHPAGAAYVIVAGVAQSRRSVAGGEQQILAVHLAGDVVGLPPLLYGQRAAELTALTEVRAARLPKGAFLNLIEAHPALWRLFARDMARDAAITQEWMVGLGRRSAYARTAHLMCELFVRQVGTLTPGGARCPFPLRQAELADAMGLSVVHVNRVLQRLRAEGLICLDSGTLTILDWSALAAVAGFDPAYLAPFDKVPTPPPFPEPAR